ncbi:MAG: polysaccharide deacetylase family protein [Planctomycetota bacterium]|nr:MAG: polysaccharide deacetylase family protein [Planctomycetota bacterium]
MHGHLRLDPLVLAAGACTLPWLGWASLPLTLGLGIAAHARAITDPRCAWYGPTHYRCGDHAAPGVALTFDDGPHPESTPRILDLLASHQQQATFFVIGCHIPGHQAILRRMIDEGHEIGVHSQHHDRRFALRSARRQGADIDACRDAISQATGQAPPRLFRPPVGLRGPATADVLRRRQMLLVTWSASARDGCGGSPERSLKRLLPHWRPGAILVLHDGAEPGRPRDLSPSTQALSLLLAQAPAGLPSRALIPSPDNRLSTKG